MFFFTDQNSNRWSVQFLIFIIGLGLFSDTYHLMIIDNVTHMLGYVYFKDAGNLVPPKYSFFLRVSTAFGTICGELLFGILADHAGRRKIYGAEALFILFSTIGTVLSFTPNKASTLMWLIIFWRFVLGIGIGGDISLSAVITSEFSAMENRGRMIGLVFAMQGLGLLTLQLVSAATLYCFRIGLENGDVDLLDQVWRICIGIGIIPILFVFYFRLTFPETPRYLIDVGDNSVDDEHLSFFHYITWRKPAYLLFCTSFCWFCLGLAFFGLNLNMSILLRVSGFSDASSPYEVLLKSTLGHLTFILFGSIPGYCLTIFLIDRIGRRSIQIQGFFALSVIYTILAVSYNKLLKYYDGFFFVVCITLAMFFQNFGPNVTTFIVPAELFITRFRARAYAISAACGKSGALFAQFLWAWKGHESVTLVLGVSALFMFFGMVVSLILLPETKGIGLRSAPESYKTGERRRSVVLPL